MTLLLGAMRLALSAIARNKLRAALTVLGILIGVTAVVMVTALAGGASASVGDQIDSFASNALYVNPESVQQSGVRDKTLGRLTEGDGRAIAREAVSVTHVAPWLSAQGQVVYGDRNVATLLAGTTREYFPIRRFEIGKGELWTESDELVKTKVCVIGQTVADKLFGSLDPVGRTIRIGRSPFRIIGTLEPKGSSPFGEDQDDRILMPIGSFRGRVMRTWPGRVDMLMASASSEETTPRAQAQITAILRQRHRIPEGGDSDFRVNTQSEFRQAQQAISGVLSALLLSVAGVSLVVGGIGVMNIMLVSVTERTREIGIRMATGARTGNIMQQFLIEALVVSALGGVVGVACGLGAAAAIGAFGTPIQYSLLPVLLAFGCSFATGLIFGYLPARKAAGLDPVVALASE